MSKLRFHLLAAAVAMIAGAGALSGSTINLVTQPAYTGAAGSTVQILVDLMNTTGSTIVLNGISVSGLAGLGATPIDTTPFFIDPSVPLSLAGGASANAARLFDVVIPAGTVDGPYTGAFTLLGGVDEVAQDNLGQSSFVVDVSSGVPEPGGLGLMLVGTGVLAAAIRRRHA